MTSRSKYLAKKVTRDGMTFDSTKEYKRWQELVLLERGGQIQNLQRQVKYILVPAQREPDFIGVRGGVRPGKVVEREIAYVADFTYQENGKPVVEDVKGYRKGNAYAMFVVKRKLMLWVHGIRVREV